MKALEKSLQDRIRGSVSSGDQISGERSTNFGHVFSATPRYPKGGLFTWTVFDYPLKQAIIDNVVKRPTKGRTAPGSG